jgi:hypothetical protein
MLSRDTIERILENRIEKDPYDHLVIDNFFDEEYAEKLVKEFPAYNDSNYWYSYDNPIEIKRTCNSWDKFPTATYRAFWALCSEEFTSVLEKKFGVTLKADYGLNGGGWHMHGAGGKLNMHKDYSTHPKIPYERKYNIIIHLSKDWNPLWGGALQMWSHDAERDRPKHLVKKVDIKFNRAVIFDTTQNSWHGLPDPLRCPPDVFRRSLAIYYVTKLKEGVDPRYRALFAPTKEQENDKEVLELIEKRTQVQR